MPCFALCFWYCFLPSLAAVSKNSFKCTHVYKYSIVAWLADAAVNELYCEESLHVCPNKTVQCTCRISNSITRWRVPQREVDIQFSSVACTGDSRTERGFTATLTLVQNGRTSVLAFPASESLSGAEVTCEDLFDGGTRSVFLNISYAGEYKVWF